MNPIPEFTEHELWVIRTALEERFGKPIEPELAESELRLDPHSSELTPCPTLFWKERGASFAIFKVGDQRYRNLFFYSVRKQYGTGIDEYTDLTECVITLLQTQADYEAKQREEQEKEQHHSRK